MMAVLVIVPVLEPVYDMSSLSTAGLTVVEWREWEKAELLMQRGGRGTAVKHSSVCVWERISLWSSGVWEKKKWKHKVTGSGVWVCGAHLLLWCFTLALLVKSVCLHLVVALIKLFIYHAVYVCVFWAHQLGEWMYCEYAKSSLVDAWWSACSSSTCC